MSSPEEEIEHVEEDEDEEHVEEDEDEENEQEEEDDNENTSEIGSLLADTPIPSTNAQDNDNEDHTPLLVPTHENTNTPDSPTHDTEQPQHSESEQQDELSLEQSLQDDSYKQVSIGPTPNSDFTAPDADYTDPNQYVEGECCRYWVYLRWAKSVIGEIPTLSSVRHFYVLLRAHLRAHPHARTRVCLCARPSPCISLRISNGSEC
eukprot:g82476.t1